MKTLTILLSSLTILVACTLVDGRNNANNENIKDSISSTNIQDDIDKITDNSFKEFVLNFKKVSLPFVLNRSNWINIADGKEIDRTVALKYLLGNNKEKVIQPTGGFYQYYYAYRLPINEYVAIMYYRPSDSYSGYFLATFTLDGKLLNDLFVSGEKGEYDPTAQLESRFNGDSILTSEIIIKDSLKYNVNNFTGIKTQKLYKIDGQGKVTKSDFFKISEGIYFTNKEKNYMFDPK